MTYLAVIHCKNVGDFKLDGECSAMCALQREFLPTIIEQSAPLLSHADEVATLKSLLTALVMHDDATNAHACRMVHWAVATGRYLHLSKEEIQLLRLAT